MCTPGGLCGHMIGKMVFRRLGFPSTGRPPWSCHERGVPVWNLHTGRAPWSYCANTGVLISNSQSTENMHTGRAPGNYDTQFAIQLKDHIQVCFLHCIDSLLEFVLHLLALTAVTSILNLHLHLPLIPSNRILNPQIRSFLLRLRVIPSYILSLRSVSQNQVVVRRDAFPGTGVVSLGVGEMSFAVRRR